MQRLLSTFLAAMLLSCRQPAAKVTSDFSGWPIDVNQLISSIQTRTGCKIEIKEEFKDKISPTAPYGFILSVHSRSDAVRQKVLDSAFPSIIDGLKAKGCKILSTEPTSCKTDFRFVYAGTLTHGSLTLKKLSDEGCVELIICLSEDIPNDTANQAEQPGAAQPATQPADKVPEKDQPPPPTSKDNPR